jgi:hypothetical protein
MNLTVLEIFSLSGGVLRFMGQMNRELTPVKTKCPVVRFQRLSVL